MRGVEETDVAAGDMVSMCSFRAGEGLFGIDTGQIREVLGRITPQHVPLAVNYIAGVVPYRGDVLTTVSFRVLLGLERGSGAGCVLVLDDDEGDLRFGLLVDEIGGVLTMSRDELQPNPSALDARSMALFCGAYRMQTGLMVRLNSQSLRPSQLAECGLFDSAKHERAGIQK
ncbi:MAG TPA: chemotaxis protein CheW [Acidobacteriaceae bacterium]